MSDDERGPPPMDDDEDMADVAMDEPAAAAAVASDDDIEPTIATPAPVVAAAAPPASKPAPAPAPAAAASKSIEDLMDNDDDDDGSSIFASVPIVKDEPKPAAAAPAPVRSPSPPPPAAPAPAPVSSPTPAAATPARPATVAVAPAPAAAAAAAAAAAPAPTAAPAAGSDGVTFTVTVGDPEKVGDGFSSYMAYRLTVHTSLASYRQSEFSITRRFSDFFALYKLLVQKFPGIIIPLCPPKDAVSSGLIKFKSHGNEITPFIVQRRAALERFVQRIVDHPTLRDDETVHLFLETDHKMPKPKGDLIDSLVAKLASFTERDEWFVEKEREIDALEAMLKRLHGALEDTVAVRREMANSTTKFAESFAALAQAEDAAELQEAMNKLADVEAKVAKLQLKQADHDYFEFSEIVSDYLWLVTAIRLCFQQRMDAFRRWQNAESTLVKKRESEAKAKVQNKMDKIALAEHEVKAAEQQLDETRTEFDAISRRIKGELERFTAAQVKELQHVVIDYVESLMTLEHQTVKAWEAFLPDAKAIPVA